MSTNTGSKTPAQRGKAARTKGHNFERQTVKKLREVPGFENATTSRATNPVKDALGVDIDIPCLNVQCKNTKKFTNPIPILEGMPDGELNIVSNKVGTTTVVSMTEDTFLGLLHRMNAGVLFTIEECQKTIENLKQAIKDSSLN